MTFLISCLWRLLLQAFRREKRKTCSIVKRSKGTFTENGYMRISEAAGRAVAGRAWKLVRDVGGDGQRLVVGGREGALVVRVVWRGYQGRRPNQVGVDMSLIMSQKCGYTLLKF